MNSIIQWVLSALLILNLWLMGNKSIWGPITGVIVQVIWCFYAFATHQYGLAPGVIILTIIQIRNWVKWSKDMKAGL